MLSGAMCDELAAAAARLDGDPAVRVVVLTGAGRELLRRRRPRLDARAVRRRAAPAASPRPGGSPACSQALNTLRKPLIGRVNGAAYGGGVGLMAVCDAVVAVATARFALTETRLGLIPATISPYVLARLGEGRARAVFFSGRVFDAEEAQALGLVTRVAAPDALDAAVEAEVAPYFATAPARGRRRQAPRPQPRAAHRRRGDRRDHRPPRRHLGDAGGAGRHRRLPREAPAALGRLN